MRDNIFWLMEWCYDRNIFNLKRYCWSDLCTFVFGHTKLRDVREKHKCDYCGGCADEQESI